MDCGTFERIREDCEVRWQGRYVHHTGRMGKSDWQQLLMVPVIDHRDSSVNVLVGFAWILSLGKIGF